MIKILPIKPITPYFKVVVNYMIGDANGDIQEELHYTKEQLEEVIPLILALNRLKPLKGHWGICFENLPEEYPGEYIGVSEEEYKWILKEIDPNEESILANEWENSPLHSDREGYFTVFEGITVTYIDENNSEHEVEIS